MDKKLDATEYKLYANQDFDSMNYSVAYVKYSRALKNQPNDYDSLSYMTNILDRVHKYKAAEVKSRRLIRPNQNNGWAYLMRGTILDSLKKHEEAEIAYRESLKYGLKYEPDAAGVHHNLAICLKKQGRYLESLESCQRVIEIDPDDSCAWNIKGYICFLTGDYMQAVICFDKAISLHPEECIAYLNKAIVYYLLKKKKEAKKILDLMCSVAENNTDYTEEFEIYSDELERLEKVGRCERRREEKRRKTCIEGIKFIINFIESELKVKSE